MKYCRRPGCMRIARAFRSRCDEHYNQPDECTCVYWEGALAIPKHTCPVHVVIIFGGNNVKKWTAQDEERFQEMSKRRDTAIADNKIAICAAVEQCGMARALAEVGVNFKYEGLTDIPPPPREPPRAMAVTEAVALALTNNAAAVCEALEPYRTDRPDTNGFVPRYPIHGRD